MYSVVLMAALTTGAASEGCNWGGGCHGWGGGGCHGGLGGGWGGGHGCYGGGYSHGCWGCYGGGYYNYACYGGGCFGWGNGGAYYGWGGYGGGGYGVYGCAGCYGGWSGYGSGYNCTGGYYSPYHVMPGGPGNPYMPGAPGGEKLPPPNGKEEQSRAKVIIDVPQNAKLFIDGQQMPDKAGKRTFVTPALEAGQTYYYDVKIVVTVNGQPREESTRVILRQGDVVAASFPQTPGTGLATAQSGQK
jgi:uncharacterized protein (TIGR03000 family)